MIFTVSSQLTAVAALVPVSALGVVCCVHLLRRAPNWPVRILTVLLGLMPIYQTVSLAIETGYLGFPPAAQWRMVSDLTINVLFLCSVFLLERAAEQGHKARVQLRVMEAAVPAGSPAAVPLAPPHSEPAAGASAVRPPDEA